jgi:uncharacterized protein (DUF2147 family)
MCTIIKKGQKPQKALEDIVVYKTLRHVGSNRYSSEFMNFTYELGKTYRAKMTFESEIFPLDDKEEKAWKDSKNVYLKDIKNVGTGFHSSTNKKRLKPLSSDSQLMKCIIPKGTLYYQGRTDLIVSSKIKIIEPC